MDFPKEPEKTNNVNFRRTEFLITTPGTHIVRLIPPIYTEYTHYVNRMTIACIGDDCPVCMNNKRIIMENPDSFKDVPGYSYPRMTRYINVLDRTPVKICTCGEEIKAGMNGDFPTACKCNNLITGVEVTPLNKVKVLSRGKVLFEQIELLDRSKRDANNEPIGVENYDIELMVGKNKQPVPSARLDRMDEIEVKEDALFDLENAVIRLEIDEISELLRGVSLKDIFASRRAESQPADESDIPAELEEEIAESVSKLFG